MDVDFLKKLQINEFQEFEQDYSEFEYLLQKMRKVAAFVMATRE